MFTINLDTGDTNFIGSLHLDPGRYTTPVSMAVRPSDGVIFVVNNSPAPPDSGISTVDPVSGLATLVAGSNYNTLAFDSSDVLYTQNSSNRFGTVNLGTGVITSLGGPDLGIALSALDFNAADGFLYGMNIGGTNLYRIDRNTGTFTLIPVVGALSVVGTLMFDANGTLVGSDTANGNLFDIDITTGIVSNLRGISASNLRPQGMGRMFSNIPIPPVTALFGICTLVLAAWRRN